MHATGTTLGADNGIGVAACLALMEGEPGLVHGPIEALLTVDEEDDMCGAEQLAPHPFLRSHMLINVDGEWA